MSKEIGMTADDDGFILESKAIIEGLGGRGQKVRRFQAPPGRIDPDRLKRGDEEAIVGAGTTVVELGHPVTTSVCLGLLTANRDLVTGGQVTLIGQELDELPRGRHPVVLLVIAEATEVGEPQRRALMKCPLSFDLLAGCMVRMSSNKIWLRFNEEALSRHLTLGDMAVFLLSELKKNGFPRAEVGFVTGMDHANAFAVVAEGAAAARSTRYREELVERMECATGLDCDECPETDTCKVLKDAVAVRRRKASA